jgi:3-hydroxybutyryl-CoA dehydratase
LIGRANDAIVRCKRTKNHAARVDNASGVAVHEGAFAAAQAIGDAARAEKGRAMQEKPFPGPLGRDLLGAVNPNVSELAHPEWRILYFEDLAVGMSETVSHTVTAAEVTGFAELTGDKNPIHLDEKYAATTQFKTRIAHGAYTAGLISAVLGTRLPGPGAIYASQTLNFRAPVRIGDTVDVTVSVAELIPERLRARLSCVCEVRSEVVLEGEALVKVPSIVDIPRS